MTMSSTHSLLQALQTERGRSQMFFKSALTALSHALEDIVLAGDDQPLVIANFQNERFYQKEVRRYERISKLTNHVYILAAPESESGFAVNSGLYETVPLADHDALAQEWHLVIISARFAGCLICRELPSSSSVIDQARRFEGFWGFDRQVCLQAAQLLLQWIVEYRPELKQKVNNALTTYQINAGGLSTNASPSDLNDSSIFGQRLMTYLQASQYKLLKAYRALDEKSQKEQLINVVTTAIRRSLEPEEVLKTAVIELGQVFQHCRCILYRCHLTDTQVMIDYEANCSETSSLKGRPWSLTDNPLIQVALSQERATVISNVAEAPVINSHGHLKAVIEELQIQSWLLVPIQYQGSALGMVELHYCGPAPHRWKEGEISLVEALATQVGVALSQADMFTQSAALNQQLQALERTQQNLINIVGHELRTPLSTIQVCLESLDSEPEMELDIRKIMLETALGDAARIRKLVSDFLLLSRLESQPASLQVEAIEFEEVLELAMSGIKADGAEKPEIRTQIQSDMPSIDVDGDGLVEVLSKLLDNACKFTPATGCISVHAEVQDQSHSDLESTMLAVTVEDTGRGIAPEQLKTIFNSFYQTEDYLRRSVGGAGLGLSICRQLITAMDGEIWAESDGVNQGSRFQFRLPIEHSKSYAMSK